MLSMLPNLNMTEVSHVNQQQEQKVIFVKVNPDCEHFGQTEHSNDPIYTQAIIR